MSKKSKRSKIAPRPVAKTAPLPEKRSPAMLWGILVLALAVRIFYLNTSRQSYPFFEPLLLDPAYYHQWALRLLSHGFSQEGVFYGLPLYPCFLALCYKLFNVSILAVKWV